MFRCSLENKKQVAAIIKRWELGTDPTGKLHIDAITAKRAVHARIRWELWTNGENLEILEIKN